MDTEAIFRLTDAAVLRGLASALSQEHAATAVVLAHLAEVEERKLFVPAGYSSMFAYCVGRLRMSEDATLKRLQAARTARQFPAIFQAMAEGRLSLTGVGLLAPHLTRANADELLRAAASKTKSEIKELLAERFPRSEILALVETLPAGPLPVRHEHAPAHVEATAPVCVEHPTEQHAQAHVHLPIAPARIEPLAPRRFELRLSMGQSLHDKLRHAQELLSHQITAGDVAAVLERALDVLIPQLEKQKFAATTRPQTKPRATRSRRHIPAHVKRAVWKRDQHQCTFVSEDGHRCQARTQVELDHIEPVARGCQATAANMRLRCRAHNQYAAEQTFGAAFMRHKREEAQRAAAEETRMRVAEEEQATMHAPM